MTLPVPPNLPQRVAFAGTPGDAVPVLRALVEARFEVPVVVTGAPRRRSRRGSDAPSPVAVAAAELGLQVSFDPADLADGGADCAVVVAYGRLISAELLERTPMLNLHFSLLPRWRGAAPVERALLAGDKTTGVCLMALEESLDTGPVYWRHEVPIGSADTAAGLRERLADEGAARLVTSLRDGLGDPVPQQGTPSYARKLTSADRRIDWSQPADYIDRLIRVGGAWTTLDGQRFIIRAGRAADQPPAAPQDTSPESAAPLDASSEGAANRGGALTSAAAHDASPGTLVGDAVVTGQGRIVLDVVQPAGRGAVDVHAWLRGAHLPAGVRFG